MGGSDHWEDRVADVLSGNISELASAWGRTAWDVVLRQEPKQDQMTCNNLRTHFLYEE